MPLRFRPSPTTVLSGAALFFALGGSALAVGNGVLETTAAQPSCANGAVRGVAAVVGDAKKGIANLPDSFTASPGLFNRRFNCTGRAIEVRRVNTGVFEVRFVGNAAPNAVANAISDDVGSVSVGTVSPGVFRVWLRSPNANANVFSPVDAGFMVVAV